MNILQISGKLLGKPKIASLGSSKKVGNFRILNKETIKGKEKEEKSLYISCVAWDDLTKQLEELEEHDTVSVVGQLIYSAWGEGKNKRSTMKVVVSKLEKLYSPQMEEPVSDIPVIDDDDDSEKVPF